MRYTLVRGTHGRFENGVFVQYGLGDTIELTAAEGQLLQGRIEAAGSVINRELSTPIQHPGSEATSVESEWSFLDDLHHVKAVEVVRGLDDSEQVQAALDYELAHKNRPSVTFAAKDRIKEIVAADDDSVGGSGEDEG